MQKRYLIALYSLFFLGPLCSMSNEKQTNQKSPAADKNEHLSHYLTITLEAAEKKHIEIPRQYLSEAAVKRLEKKKKYCKDNRLVIDCAEYSAEVLHLVVNIITYQALCKFFTNAASSPYLVGINEYLNPPSQAREKAVALVHALRFFGVSDECFQQILKKCIVIACMLNLLTLIKTIASFLLTFI